MGTVAMHPVKSMARRNSFQVRLALWQLIGAFALSSILSVPDLVRADDAAELARLPRISREIGHDQSVYTVESVSLSVRSTRTTIRYAEGKFEQLIELQLHDMKWTDVGMKWNNVGVGLFDDQPAYRRTLEHSLDLRVAKLCDDFDLNSAQEEKVWLAGRGDLRRLGQRLDKIKEKLNRPLLVEREDSLEALKWIAGLAQEAKQMRTALEEDPFSEGSFLDKVLRRQLTPNQVEQYDQRYRRLVPKAVPQMPRF